MNTARSASAQAFALAAILGAARVQAEPELTKLELDWPVVEHCPSPAAMRHAVARLLVGQRSSGQIVRAKVAVVHGEQVVLHLVTTTKSGTDQRQLKGESCAQVADAAAVILAMMIDPESVGRPRPASVAVPVPADEPGSPVPMPRVVGPPELPSTRASRVELRFSVFATQDAWQRDSFAPTVSVGMAVSAGIKRTPLYGVGVGIDGGTKRMGWSLQGGYAPEHRVALLTDPTRGVELASVRVALGVGPRMGAGRFTSVPRIGASAQGLHVRGFGTERRTAGWIYWWSLTVGHALSFSITEGLLLKAAVDLERVTHRPAAYLDPGGNAVRPDRLIAQAFLGVSGRY